MTWSLSASGHCDSAQEETALVERLRPVLAEAEGVSSATLYTQHSGQVNLLEGKAGQPAAGTENTG